MALCSYCLFSWPPLKNFFMYIECVCTFAQETNLYSLLSFVCCCIAHLQVLVSGLLNLNRAVDSDVVAVKLLPKEEWKRPSVIFQDVAKADDNNSDDVEADEDRDDTMPVASVRREAFWVLKALAYLSMCLDCKSCCIFSARPFVQCNPNCMIAGDYSVPTTERCLQL